MTTQIRNLTVVAAAVAAMLAASMTAAFAQYPPASAFGVSCSDTVPGGTTSCAVVGAQADEQLTATAEYGTTVFYNETFNADANGEAAFSFTVPAEAEGQTVTVTVVGVLSGTTGDTLEVEDESEAGTPVAGAPAERLPFTGGEVGMFLAVGILLLAGGLVALRRREDAKVSGQI